MARNRKRAKERRARRPGDGPMAATARLDRDEVPGPLEHAAPDVELAEEQMAFGRPELTDDELGEPAGEPEPEETFDRDGELEAEALEAEALGARGGEGAGGGRRGLNGGDVGALPSGGGGSVAPVPVRRERELPGTRLVNFLQGSWRELQRVQWPDRRQVMQATGVVIGFVIVAGVFLGVADTLAGKLMNFILK